MLNPSQIKCCKPVQVAPPRGQEHCFHIQEHSEVHTSLLRGKFCSCCGQVFFNSHLIVCQNIILCTIPWINHVITSRIRRYLHADCNRVSCLWPTVRDKPRKISSAHKSIQIQEYSHSRTCNQLHSSTFKYIQVHSRTFKQDNSKYIQVQEQIWTFL